MLSLSSFRAPAGRTTEDSGAGSPRHRPNNEVHIVGGLASLLEILDPLSYRVYADGPQRFMSLLAGAVQQRLNFVVAVQESFVRPHSDL